MRVPYRSIVMHVKGMDNAPLNPGHLNKGIMPTLYLFSLGGKLSYPSLCTGLQHRILDWAVEPGSDICCHLNWTGVKLALMFLKDLFVHPDTLQSTVPSPDEEGSSVLMKHCGFSWEPWINKQLLDLKKKSLWSFWSIVFTWTFCSGYWVHGHGLL